MSNELHRLKNSNIIVRSETFKISACFIFSDHCNALNDHDHVKDHVTMKFKRSWLQRRKWQELPAKL